MPDGTLSVVGSKGASGAWQRIVSMLPAHRVFVEGFAGGAAITLRKRPVDRTLLIERDPQTAAALRSVVGACHGIEVIEGSALEVLKPAIVASDWCLYFDPPYVMSARKSQRRYYRCEWDDSDHVRFLEWVRGFSCPVLISGYWSQLYASRLEDWRCVSFGVQTRRGRAIEHVWMNFPEPLKLHETGYVGRDFTDRQRIKRKAARWVRMLAAMPAGECAAVLTAINDWAAAQLPASTEACRHAQLCELEFTETSPTVQAFNGYAGSRSGLGKPNRPCGHMAPSGVHGERSGDALNGTQAVMGK